MNIDELVKLLNGHKVYIQMHNSPDPDAIGSAFGLQYILEKKGIKSTICCYGNIDKLNAIRMLEVFNIKVTFFDEHSVIDKEDYIIVIDVQKGNNNLTAISENIIGCIDHHPVVREVDYEYEDIRKVGACCTIIAEYFNKSNIQMTSDIATALAYGMKIDTSEFLRGVEEIDVEMFSNIFPYVNRKQLADLYNSTLELKDLNAYRAAIDSINVIESLGFAYIPFGFEDALIGMISDFILSIDVVLVSIVASERQQGVKISVRSEINDVHSGKLIHKSLEGDGNGGGHSNMAGGFIPKENLKNIDIPNGRLIEMLVLDYLKSTIEMKYKEKQSKINII